MVGEGQTTAAEEATEQSSSSEAMFRALVEDSADLVALLNVAAATITYVSPSVTRILGYSPDEVLGRSGYDLIHPDDQTEASQRIADAAVQQTPGASSEFKTRLRHQDGGWRWVSVNVTNLLAEPGVQGLLLCRFQNITERREAEEAIGRSEARCRLAVAQANGVLYQMDLATNCYTYISESIEQVTGYKADEFTCTVWDALIDEVVMRGEAAGLSHQEAVERALRGGLREWRADYRIRTKQGETRWLTDDAIPLYDEQGNPYASLGILQDITERKRVEEDLRRVTSQAHCLLWSADVEEVGEEFLHWTLQPSNQEAAQRFLPIALVPGQSFAYSWFVASLPEDRARTEAFGNAMVRAGRNYRQEFRFRMADGSIRWLQEDVQVETLETGKGWRAVGVCTDVTERKAAEEALKESEERFRLAAETASDLIYEWDIVSGRLQWFGDIDGRLGYELGEFPRTLEAWSDTLHPEDRERVTASLERYLERGERFVEEYRVRTKGDTWLHWTDRGTTLRDSTGKARKMIGSCTDITARKQADEERKWVTSRAQCLIWVADVEDVGEPVLQWRIDPIDEAAAQRFLPLECAPGQAYCDAWYQSRLPEDSERMDALSEQQVRAGKSYSQDFRCRDKHGKLRWLKESVQIETRGPGRWRAVGVCTDITERKQAEEALAWQANHDLLTGLPNRILFQDRLEQALTTALRHQQEAAVLFLDLDGFKHINDTLGHAVGDQLLQIIAIRLAGLLRAEDTVARMGGDEFTVLLPFLEQAQDAAVVAQKLLQTITAPIALEGQELYVSASIGISVFPFDGRDGQTLLKNADVAMYRAKDQGRNGYLLYTEAMNSTAFERLFLESSLRKALEQGEFLLNYQPQIEAESGHIIGVEALIRWRHPDMGIIAPAKFIPLAEETGLIIPLGEWVLREACRQAALWQAQGHPLIMSINLSARQFDDRELVSKIRAILLETGLDPAGMELEMTEGAIIHNTERTVQILRELRALGLRLCVDDFGTGYSSLSYLRRFPLDVLKVDRSFVQDLTDDAAGQAIVRAVIDLAHALRLKVVAEGVETEAQRECLAALGCDFMQGFLFSPPVSLEKLEAVLEGARINTAPR